MMLNRPSLFAVLCAAFVAFAPLSGCASGDRKSADAAELKEKRKKKDARPKNYSLFKKHELNQSLLRRGQKAMQSPALDSY